MNAIISVSDKTQIELLANSFSNSQINMISTGGTYTNLQGMGFSPIQVSDFTKFPEILGGRVKTLHPNIHAGILAKRNDESQMGTIKELNIQTIDFVIVNLYPFIETVSNKDVTLETALENIDIGGPTLLRAAAKNFPSVLVVVDPKDYTWISERIDSGGVFFIDERKKLARKAFQHVAVYDTAISSWLNDESILSPSEISFGLNKIDDLRYGENPHQTGAVYSNLLGTGGIVNSRQIHGMPMSYTNYLDADSAWTTVNSFDQNACVIVKHTNPCGIALDNQQSHAFKKAFEGDSVSAYGGIVGFNNHVELDTANSMKGILFDIIIAPSYSQEALQVLQKRKRTRILIAEKSLGINSDINLRTISGGYLLQSNNDLNEDPSTWKIVSKRQPTEKELKDLTFAWKCLKHIKSNSIVLAKDNTLTGMGAGQPNRVVSIHLALRIAGQKATGSCLASDAFMPFADNIEMAHQGGIKAIIQPGGSIRDDDVINSVNEFDMAMVFTGTRHFTH